MPELPRDEAHLWLAEPRLHSDDWLLRHAHLTEAESVRWQRYAFADDRREYLLTRVLARTALSSVGSVAPREWSFEVGAHGKPRVADPRGVPLAFNLSNTRGLVACLVACGPGEVGVDVEETSRVAEPDEIATHFFSPPEVASLRTLPAAERRARFYDLWTLKESYIKARGLGLAIPLEQFSFFSAESPIRLELDSRLEDDPARWQHALLRPTPRHVAAATLAREPGAGERKLVVRWLRLEDVAG